MKATFSDKTRRAATLLALFAILCAARPVKAQYYYYSPPWNGPIGIAILSGMHVPFSQNQYSATNYNYKLVDESQLMFCPYIGLSSSAFDRRNHFFHGSDVNLTFAKGRKSFTFNDDGHNYTTTSKLSFIEFNMNGYVGYSISDQLSVNIRSGVIFSNALTNNSRQTIDNGEEKPGGFEVKNVLFKGGAICHIPIDLFVNYLINDHWFIRGSLDTRLITLKPMEGDVTFNEKNIHVKNTFKSIGCSVTFGYWKN